MYVLAYPYRYPGGLKEITAEKVHAKDPTAVSFFCSLNSNFACGLCVCMYVCESLHVLTRICKY